MKKAITVFSVMVLVLSFGTAFAGGVKAEAGKIDNGITYSDPGTAQDCNQDPAKAGQEKTAALSNGITATEMRESGAKGSCANKAEKEIKSSKPYNGVTGF